jgi:hypothetical protein
MNTQGMKLDLISWIAELNDYAILQQLENYKDAAKSDWWNDLPYEIKESILEGKVQIQKGESYEHTAVLNELSAKYPQFKWQEK